MSLYLVTGGCGFIGSHLSQALINANHQVRIIDDLSTGLRVNAPKDAELLVCDITNYENMKMAFKDVDGCFHLAAKASIVYYDENWPIANQINLGGTINTFAASRSCRKNGKAPPVVYASSAAIYGGCEKIPLAESTQALPLTGYAADKLACEINGNIAFSKYDIANIGLRFFNVFGPRQNPESIYSGVISIFVNRLLQGQNLTVYGDGLQVRDFIYVDDVVQALMLSMQYLENNHSCNVYNVSTNMPTSIRGLISTLGQITGLQPEVIYAEPRLGDPRLSAGLYNKAKTDLGFNPETSLKDGLLKTIQYIAGERSKYQSNLANKYFDKIAKGKSTNQFSL